MGERQILFHGSYEKIEIPEIRITKYNKDFYFGFYCTVYEKQAKRWATRFTGKGVISKFEFIPDETLNIKNFHTMTEEWLDFIVACRSGKEHCYDVVEGPMADDTVFNYVQNFIDGKISRESFWKLVEFKYPTHQISFHTERALSCLKFIESYEVTDEK